MLLQKTEQLTSCKKANKQPVTEVVEQHFAISKLRCSASLIWYIVFHHNFTQTTSRKISNQRE